MKRIVLSCILLMTMSGSLLAGDFPKVKGWKPVSDPLTFTADNLWEYINGAAEQFISYHFQELRVCDVTDGKVTVTIHIYNMGTPLNAFGIYKSQRPKDANLLAIGTEAVVLPPYQCLMVKDIHYIKVEAFDGEITQTLGVSLLKAVANALPGKDRMPDVFTSFPEEGRIPDSEGFTRESFLGLSELKQCIYVNYRGPGDEIYQVFQILPEGNQTVESQWERLKTRWKVLRDDTDMLYRNIPYTGYVGVRRTDNRIIGVSATESEGDLKRLLDSVTLQR
jgi:hypothetical protein